MVSYRIYPDLRTFCCFLLVESGPVFGIFLQKPVISDDTLGYSGGLDYR